MIKGSGVLITVPCLQVPGGVTSYYRTIRPLFDANKIYFEVGARPGNSGPIGWLLRLARDYWRFSCLLRRDDIGLVHLNPSLGRDALLRDALFLLISKVIGIPVVVFFHGWEKDVEKALRIRWARLFRFTYGRADVVVVLANEFAETLRDLGLNAPVIVETTVVPDGLFDEGGAVPRPVPAGSGTCNILFLSRLDRDKGLIEAVDAVAQISHQFPGVTLIVAGEGPERASGEARARAAGLRCVEFVGHLEGDAWVAAFRNADVYLFPTFYGEGMPTAVLEAMAFGLPVVTRPVGGLRDFFEDGRMGFLTESRDPAVFAELLARLVADPALRASMGRYNREYARRRFSGSVVAARLLDLYAKVARQTSPG